MLTRRQVLAGAAVAAPAPRRPNILFVMVDEMRWDAMSSEKHPVVSTPNLDRLARQGTRFSNAYTVAPVCSPARACVFTGRYCDVNGVTANGIPANDGEIFLPSILKHYGYHTAISGKLHYSPRRFDYGFDRFWTFSTEGPTPEAGFVEYLRRKHNARGKWDIVPGTCPWPDDPLGSDVGIYKYPEEDFETEWITDRSIEYLRSRQGKQEPFFLFTSYLKPHSPSVEPRRWFEKYDPRAIPIPKLPANIREIRATQQGRGKRQYIDDEQMLRVISAAYYGAIAHVDDQIGRLLGELDRLGMAGDTLVLFTADHGNMLGDRGRMFKGVMYEGSSHVPLIWRGPRGAAENKGRVESKIVENTDLLPAILETAGIPIPDGVQGKSFLGLIRGGDPRWKNRCFSQLRTAMLRTDRYKLIDNSRNLRGALELYDLVNDPKEERNLSSDPRHRDFIEDARRRLTEWRADKPAPVRIAGMPAPAYARLDPNERKELIENAPDRVERRNLKQGGRKNR